VWKRGTVSISCRQQFNFVCGNILSHWLMASHAQKPPTPPQTHTPFEAAQSAPGWENWERKLSEMLLIFISKWKLMYVCLPAIAHFIMPMDSESVCTSICACSYRFGYKSLGKSNFSVCGTRSASVWPPIGGPSM